LARQPNLLILMQVSPLQLKQHFITKVSIDQRDKRIAAPIFGPCEISDIPVTLNIEHGMAVDESQDPRNFMIRLGMIFDGEKKTAVPYDICIELVGFFEVASTIEKGKRAPLVLANGAAILYNAARECIALLTSRFAKGFVTLPSVNFIDDANQLEKQIKASARSGEKAKKPQKAVVKEER